MPPVHKGALRVASVDKHDAVLRRDGNAERKCAAHGEKCARHAWCAEQRCRRAGASKMLGGASQMVSRIRAM